MKFEMCVASAKGADLAVKYKVDRIELCQNLEFGGTTPTQSLVEYCLNLNLEVHVLLRSRIGGFNYSDKEIELMIRDLKIFKGLGVAGFVVGCLDENGKIHEAHLQAFQVAAGNCELTFHRAFDDLQDWREGIETLHKYGVKRVLTAGLASSVDVGVNNLAFIKEASRGKLELMVGGGVTPRNVSLVLSKSLPDAVHFSATNAVVELSESKFAAPRLEADENKLVQILNAAR